MPGQRRDFLKQLFAAGAVPSLFSKPAAFALLLDPQAVKEANPDYDAASHDFWSSFTEKTGRSVVAGVGQTRSAGDPTQPVFLHHGPDGFKNASLLDQAKLVEEGDVVVSVNTSTVKVGSDDLKTFDRLQNAQLRVDVAQKTAIVPIIEAMAYTVIGAMHSPILGGKTAASSGKSSSSAKSASGKSSSSSTKGSGSSVQNISISSDAAWQKMQNIPLPGGEGRWALNLEAQKKDSLFGKVLETVVKEAGMFAPALGLPGIAMTALNSFNNLYGALHAEPVQVIKSNPIRVFATQEAIESTGSSASEIGAILLQPGTYILMSAQQALTDDQLKTLTIAQDRIVRTADAKLTGDDLDAAAADVGELKNVTYVTFDVQVKRTSLFTGASTKSSG
jgi:hypothetical protein